MRAWTRRPLLWLALILLLAAGLRVYRLPSWDMWTDEVQTLWVSQSGQFKEGPMYLMAPLNFVLTGLAVAAVGERELGVRIIPFLCGLLAVALLYPAARRWVGTRAALLGTLVLALSMWHVYWSQTGRHFALQALLLLGVLWAFLAFWKEGRRGALAALVLLSLAALLTHSSSGFFLVGLGAFIAGRGVFGRDGFSRRAWLALGASVLPLVVYGPVYLGVAAYLLENKEPWNPPWNIAGSLAFYLQPHVAVPALAGAVFLYRDRNELWAILACFAVVPMLLVTAASAVTIASAAYALGSILAIALLVGVAADRTIELAGRAGLAVPAAALVAVVFVGQAYELAHYYSVYNGLKPRWREATAFVAERRREGERVFADEGDVARFYLGPEGVGWYEEAGRADELDPSDPEPDARGAWYIVYAGEGLLGRKWDLSLPDVQRAAELLRVFPLTYGAKDRTIAVYYGGAAESRALDVEASP